MMRKGGSAGVGSVARPKAAQGYQRNRKGRFRSADSRLSLSGLGLRRLDRLDLLRVRGLDHRADRTRPRQHDDTADREQDREDQNSAASRGARPGLLEDQR